MLQVNHCASRGAHLSEEWFVLGKNIFVVLYFLITEGLCCNTTLVLLKGRVVAFLMAHAIRYLIDIRYLICWSMFIISWTKLIDCGLEKTD